MKVFNVSIMLTVHLNYLLLLLSLFASVCSFPSTPLNERNQEISWEAWLLVDDQNQNRQVQDGQVPRRRITPKSVFVAPTFSPDKLPPCAEGYSSDDMGRCVKIIKLDEDKHLDFLVNKLNQQFGSSIDYETVIEIDDPNSEPTRVEIPFISDYEDDYSNDTPEEELDMAIIVTPTTRKSDKTKSNDNSKLGKRDDNADDDLYEEELKKLLKISSTTKKGDGTTLRVETEQTTTDTLETTTLVNSTPTENSTTVQTVEEIETTTIVTTEDSVEVDETTTATTLKPDASHVIVQNEQLVEATTTTDPSTTLEVTTEVSTTTDLAETTLSTTKITTTTPKITTYHPVATTYHPYFDLSFLDDSKTKNFVKFPDEKPSIARSHPNGDYVRFPDVDAKYQQESLGHHIRDVDEQTGNFFNEIVTPQPSQRVQELVLPPKTIGKGYYSGFNLNHKGSGVNPKFFPSSDESHYQYQTGTTEKHPLKKFKGKNGNLFQLPPKWSSEDHHKPIILRFSRKHFNIDTNKFKNSEFYRSLPMDDLTYLFGSKNGQTTHR